jgi:E3 ubiquitin-protein ligase RNF14
MCWRCGKQISGYEHFRTSGACILFDEAEVLRWERRWEDEVQRHAAAQFRNDFLGEFGGALVAEGGGGGGGGGGGRPVPLPAVACPQCRQRNYKFARNNHMQCWSCSCYFCGSCRAALGGANSSRRGGKHFGPGGCKQHS